MKNLVILIAALAVIFTNQAKADFQQLVSGTNQNLFAVCFTNAQTGYACGVSGTLIKTINGGANWFALTSGSSSSLFAISRINDSTIVVVGSGVVLKTINFGASWTMSSPTGNTLRSVYFENANTGYAVGTVSTAIKTTDGGISWSPLTIPLSQEVLTSVIVNNGNVFITVSGSTNLLVSTNGGSTFDNKKTRVGSIGAMAIDFFANTGFVAGYDNSTSIHPDIFKTTDNGDNWVEIMLNNIVGQISSISIVKAYSTLVYASGNFINDPTYGSKGFILKSTDGGNTWSQPIVIGTGTIFLNGVATTTTDCYVVGTGGLILKSILPIGIVPISTEVPKSYALSQNYPNPFNPTTNINIHVQKSGNVKLIVFDITGRIVTTLVNETMRPGIYKIDFNASNLTSGVYFYRMTSNDFTDTKKMILVK